MVAVLTETGMIAEELMNTEVGDELTIETDRGRKINRKVSHIKQKEDTDYEIFVGEPDGIHLLLYVQNSNDEYYIGAKELTDNPQEPVVDRGNVEKIAFWDVGG